MLKYSKKGEIRMPFVATAINLTETQRKILEQIAKSRTLPANQIQRAKIIILASQEKNNREIGDIVTLGQDAVSKWRSRWVKDTEYFANVEKSNPELLEDEIIRFLKDRPRLGCPCEFTEEQIIKILEIACHNPAEFGYESSHWSLNQLKDVVIKQAIVASISPASISRFLKYG